MHEQNDKRTNKRTNTIYYTRISQSCLLILHKAPGFLFYLGILIAMFNVYVHFFSEDLTTRVNYIQGLVTSSKYCALSWENKLNAEPQVEINPFIYKVNSGLEFSFWDN